MISNESHRTNKLSASSDSHFIFFNIVRNAIRILCMRASCENIYGEKSFESSSCWFFCCIYCTSSCVLVQFRNDFLVFTLLCKCAQVSRQTQGVNPTIPAIRTCRTYRNVICNQHFIFRVKQFICGRICVRASAFAMHLCSAPTTASTCTDIICSAWRWHTNLLGCELVIIFMLSKCMNERSLRACRKDRY